MAVNWEVRRSGEEAPEYLPTADLFTIRMHCMVNGLERLVGFVDYVCADQISRIELLSMAKKFRLQIDKCNIWWMEAHSQNKGVFKEIVTDLDALSMAMSVDSRKEAYVCFRGSTFAEEIEDLQGDEEMYADDDVEKISEDDDVEEIAIGRTDENKSQDEFYDSYYNFGEDSVEERVGNVERAMTIVVEGEAPTIDNDADIQSDYGDSDDLHSCSSTDSENLVPNRSKYSEFNEDIDMKNPKLKIGMKFRDFRQFKEAVKNYGIKNRYVMNFKPNTRTRCKAICKNKCPFYLWASPMVKDSSTVQIKSGVLKHECTRDHRNRHVNAYWIARTYIEQFRANPTWKLTEIMQVVKINQEVQITRLTAYRAKCIALRQLDGDEETQMQRLYDYKGPMIPPEPVNKKRCMKTLLKRRELGEESRGFKNGKVSKEGVKITCGICGAAGHNRRYHGNQANKRNTGGQEGQSTDDAVVNIPVQTPTCSQMGHVPQDASRHRQSSNEHATKGMHQIPVEPIQLEIYRQHQEVGQNIQGEAIEATSTQVSTPQGYSSQEPISQVISAFEQTGTLKTSIAGHTSMERKKLNTRGYKGNHAAKIVDTFSTPSIARPPVLKAKGKNKEGSGKNKEGCATKKKNV